MGQQQTVASRRRVLRIAAGFAAITVVASACGSGKSTLTTTTTAPKVSTTTAQIATTSTAGTTPTTKSSATTSSTATTSTTAKATTTTTNGAGTVAGSTVDASGPVWERNAAQYRGQDGKNFSIDCPPNGTQASIWGTEIYTDDSSICNAAVHVGLITYAAGGRVVEYQIAPGQGSYAATAANGITSQTYAKWPGSFIFPAAPPGSGSFSVGPESWSRNAAEFQGQEGKLFAIPCSAKGEPGRIWGTNTYTSDSSICTAAVHVGLITVAEGGTVVIEIAPGKDAYQGSTANGVTSSDYGSWGSSFTFPTDQTPP